ncbi:hypothetical protein D9M72_329120 [compost metagenome]
MAAISTGRPPTLARNSRSFRQWPILDTMIITRGLTAASFSSHCMPNWSPTGANAAFSVPRSGPPAAGVKCTRMKKRPAYSSPYWSESTILQPCWNSRPETAWTMPGWSGHERVRMNPVLLMVCCSVGMARRKAGKIRSARSARPAQAEPAATAQARWSGPSQPRRPRASSVTSVASTVMAPADMIASNAATSTRRCSLTSPSWLRGVKPGGSSRS